MPPVDILPGLLAQVRGDDVLPTHEAASQRFRKEQRVIIQGASPLVGQQAVFDRLLSETGAVVYLDWMGA
jgi:hypothetical protein